MLRGDLFIDGVDSEYFLRCLSAGLRTVIAPDAALGHSLGSMTQASVFGLDLVFTGRPFLVRTAASWRYYYIFRNRVLLTREYGRMHPVWALKGILADYRHLAIVTVLASGRWDRICSALAGVFDGLAGRTGPRA
jgi:rhamnosyltransferase